MMELKMRMAELAAIFAATGLEKSKTNFEEQDKAYKPKLKVGDIVDVAQPLYFSEILLPGKYRIAKIGKLSGSPIYALALINGKKIVSQYYCNGFDKMLERQESNPKTKLDESDS